MRVDDVRRFNRFYTRRVGALREGLLGSEFSLPEARVLYEVAQLKNPTSTQLARELDLDAGYLSRLLQSLRKRGFVQAKASADDARRSLLSLTAKGRKSFAALDARSREEVAAMLAGLPAPQQLRLVGAMQTVEQLLKGEAGQPRVTLRAHRPGDMGWVVHRHGALYAQEYGWDERFEALVAQIAAQFVQRFDAARERCWIAELDGEPVGSVFVVKASRTTAKLRLLLLEPKARGRGLGKRLVEECIRFARDKGYRKLVLWTQSNLDAARAIYRSSGFKLVRKERHASFGVKLTGEYWELEL
ncbi:MAG: bifunctional helix-turn-helix transcriptional regulator/GNAT family N-acetyltransferase [Burkholderiales bacterium]